jgi:molybdate transport system substrate-binding protein
MRMFSAEETTMTFVLRPNMVSMIIAATAMMALPVSASAQIKVLISGGFSVAYEELLPQFEKSTGIKITTGSGASQGDGPQTIGGQLSRGAAADLVILSREGLDDLIASKRIAPGTDVDIAKTATGVAVRAQSSKPDVATVESFKRLLQNSKTVAAASTSGIWFANELLPKLGLAGKVNVKILPRGAGAAGMAATGEADIAILPISEILHATGVEFAGPLPAEIQFVQTFSAAVTASAGDVPSAKKLIEFLASERAFDAIKKSGLEPSATSK